MDVFIAAAALLFDFTIIAAIKPPTIAKNATRPRTRPIMSPVRLESELRGLGIRGSLKLVSLVVVDVDVVVDVVVTLVVVVTVVVVDDVELVLVVRLVVEVVVDVEVVLVVVVVVVVTLVVVDVVVDVEVVLVV